MKKISSTVAFCLVAFISNAQIIDIDYSPLQKHNWGSMSSMTTYSEPTDNSPEVLKKGFVGFSTSGNVQASAQLLKLNIGERNGFYIPLMIYTGASADALGKSQSNQSTIENLLNPAGGTINGSFNGLWTIFHTGEMTKLELGLQIGGRYINGTDSATGSNRIFINGIGNAGFFFQTGAWVDTAKVSTGVFFIQAKMGGNFSSKGDFTSVFGNGITTNYFYGYLIDAGIAIDKVIDIEISIYQFLNNTDIGLLSSPTIKLTTNYSFGK